MSVTPSLKSPFFTRECSTVLKGIAGGLLTRVLQLVGDASYAMYLNEGFLIRLDTYTTFVMGAILTLAISYVSAVAWNWLVSDRVTAWLEGWLR